MAAMGFGGFGTTKVPVLSSSYRFPVSLSFPVSGDPRTR